MVGCGRAPGRVECHKGVAVAVVLPPNRGDVPVTRIQARRERVNAAACAANAWRASGETFQSAPTVGSGSRVVPPMPHSEP